MFATDMFLPLKGLKMKRVGIVGAGRIARMHAKALQKLGANLIAVSDVIPSAAEKFAGEFNCLAVTDVEALIQLGVDVMIICTPPVGRAAIALPAIEAGIHVFLEKPMAATLLECDKMLEAARKSGVTIGINCQREFLAPVRRIWNAIEEGRFSNPVLATATIYGFRDAGYYDMDAPVYWRGTIAGEHGALGANQAPHHTSMIVSKIPQVSRLASLAANQTLQRAVECEDTLTGIAQCKGGCIVNLFYTNAMKPGRFAGIVLTDENGQTLGVQTDREMFVAQAGANPSGTSVSSQMKFAPILTEWSIEGEEDKLGLWIEEDRNEFLSLEDPNLHYQSLSVSNFLQAIENGSEPRTNGETGRKSVELTVGMYRASAYGTWLDFPIFHDENLPDDGLSLVHRYKGIPYSPKG